MGDYYSGDDLVDYTPSSAVVAGDVVVVNDTVAVAPRPIPANTLGALAVEGTFYLPKGSGAIGQLAVVYWDATASQVTTTATGNKRVGRTAKAAASSDTQVPVILNIG